MFLSEKRAKREKVAILVPNTCNPDYRVIKQAQAFEKAGYEVRIYAVKRGDVPTYEAHNGVVYIRSTWNAAIDFGRYISGNYRGEFPLKGARVATMKLYNRLMKQSEKRKPSDDL